MAYNKIQATVVLEEALSNSLVCTKLFKYLSRNDLISCRLANKQLSWVTFHKLWTSSYVKVEPKHLNELINLTNILPEMCQWKSKLRIVYPAFHNAENLENYSSAICQLQEIFGIESIKSCVIHLTDGLIKPDIHSLCPSLEQLSIQYSAHNSCVSTAKLALEFIIEILNHTVKRKLKKFGLSIQIKNKARAAASNIINEIPIPFYTSTSWFTAIFDIIPTHCVQIEELGLELDLDIEREARFGMLQQQQQLFVFQESIAAVQLTKLLKISTTILDSRKESLALLMQFLSSNCPALENLELGLYSQIELTISFGQLLPYLKTLKEFELVIYKGDSSLNILNLTEEFAGEEFIPMSNISYSHLTAINTNFPELTKFTINASSLIQLVPVPSSSSMLTNKCRIHDLMTQRILQFRHSSVKCLCIVIDCKFENNGKKWNFEYLQQLKMLFANLEVFCLIDQCKNGICIDNKSVQFLLEQIMTGIEVLEIQNYIKDWLLEILQQPEANSTKRALAELRKIKLVGISNTKIRETFLAQNQRPRLDLLCLWIKFHIWNW